jgi:hypothetical protein
MANILRWQDLDDFEFIVSNSRYHCPWFITDFSSPHVGQLHSIDITHCKLVVKTPDAKGNFLKFISLGQGKKVVIKMGSGHFLRHSLKNF